MVSILLGEQRYFEETLPISELKELLDAGSINSVRGQVERIRGLKWLLAMISKGTDVSRFFPDVIRNIMTPNLELKKLVYMYVLHYADHDDASRSAALLSINAFQRDLNDDHELIRGLALRTLTSIKVDDIQAVQALAVRTCTRDVSAYVRKIAANAVAKLGIGLSRTSEIRETFEDEVLGKLLMDASPSVMGSAASAMLEVCPDRFDLVNTAFDRLLNALPEIDEWGQISVLKLISRYARHCFTDPVLPDEALGDNQVETGAFGFADSQHSGYEINYDRDADEEYPSSQQPRKWQGVVLAPVVVTSAAKRKLPTKNELDSFLNDTDTNTSFVAEKTPTASRERSSERAPQPKLMEEPSTLTVDRTRLPMHEKHKRLLRASLPLLKSRNSAVVVAAASIMWYCGQRSRSAMQRVAQAMVRLVKSPCREIRYCALRTVLPMIRERPSPFVGSLGDCFVNPSMDAPFVRTLKLEVMCRLVRERTLHVVLRELETYVTHPNEAFAAQAVRTVGKIAVHNKRNVARDCLFGLAGFIQSEACSKRVLEESIVVAREVICRLGPELEPDELDVLQTLLRGFDRVQPNLVRARSSLVWLAKEFHLKLEDEAGDVLRAVASSFPDDAPELKLQALSLAAVLSNKESSLTEYVIQLGMFDAHFDVRDWARFLSTGGLNPSQLESAAGKGVAAEHLEENEMSQHDYNLFEVDTLSFLVGKQVQGYTPLPPWAKETRVNFPSSNKRNGRKGASHFASETTSSSESSSSSEEGDSSDEEGSSSEEEDTEEEEEESEVEEATRKLKQQTMIESHTGLVQQQTSKVDHEAEEKKKTAETQKAEETNKFSNIAVPVLPKKPVATVEHIRHPEFSLVASHVRGQGLQIESWFSRETVPEGLKLMTPVRLKFVNKLDDRNFSDIRVERSDTVVPLSEPIPLLGPGFYRDDYRILVKFGGHWRTPVKVTLLAEEIGKLTIELRASAGELLVPDESFTSEEEFSKLRRQLGGMNETYARVANPKALDVRKRVLEMANFHPLTSSTGDLVASLTDTLSFRFAARRTDSAGTRVLLEVNVALDGMLEIYVNCEYALVGHSLMDELKAAFA